jgi:putative membrane protein
MIAHRHRLIVSAASMCLAAAGFAFAQNNQGQSGGAGGSTPGAGNTTGSGQKEGAGAQHHPNTLDPSMRNTRDDAGRTGSNTGQTGTGMQDRDRTTTGTDRDRTGNQDRMGGNQDRDRTDRDNMTRGGAAAGGDGTFVQQLRQIQQNPDQAGDKLFILCASLDNQSEIELARQAQQKSQNEQVRQIAQRMIQDHEQMGQQIDRVAQSVGVQPIKQLPQWKQQEAQVMLALPEEQFNKAYLSHLKAAHAKDISKFADQAKLAQNDQVKQFAQQSLPHLQQHRQQVVQAGQQMGLASGDLGDATGGGR